MTNKYLLSNSTPLFSTYNYIKNNKIRILLAYTLDLLFFISVILVLVNFLPSWLEHAEHSNNLIKELGSDDMSGIALVSARENEIQQTKQNMENIMGSILLSILTIGNIIYAIWAGIILKKLKLWFTCLFIGLNYLVQFILWVLFGLIINIKNFWSGLSSDSSRLSVFIFIILCYVAYMKIFVFFVEMSTNKNKKDGFKKYIAFLLSSNFWKILLRYAIICILFIPILVLSQIPLVATWIDIRLLITITLTMLILIPYSTLSKIYLIESIKFLSLKK